MNKPQYYNQTNDRMKQELTQWIEPEAQNLGNEVK
jgi:hypothetical protein